MVTTPTLGGSLIKTLVTAGLWLTLAATNRLCKILVEDRGTHRIRSLSPSYRQRQQATCGLLPEASLFCRAVMGLRYSEGEALTPVAKR